ncbi:hypothetical protein [Kribbella sp. NPDC048928]|uniref:hypothetical protein n=1 Tax=Kribbella sp. NPDC048928 TaxID=3364111 RepID=UPI0037225FC8
MNSNSAAPDRGRLRAAWTLVLLAVCGAELSFTAVAVPVTWVLLPLLLVMYGAGVLLIREAVVRVGGGWPSLVLLGVHVVFSVLLPIMLIGLIFPDHRAGPFLRRGGLIAFGILAVLGVVGLRFTIAATPRPRLPRTNTMDRSIPDRHRGTHRDRTTVRWSGSVEWGPEHQLWMAGGILVSHTAFMAPAAPVSVVAGAITIVLEIVLLMLLARRVRRHAQQAAV